MPNYENTSNFVVSLPLDCPSRFRILARGGGPPHNAVWGAADLTVKLYKYSKVIPRPLWAYDVLFVKNTAVILSPYRAVKWADFGLFRIFKIHQLVQKDYFRNNLKMLAPKEVYIYCTLFKSPFFVRQKVHRAFNKKKLHNSLALHGSVTFFIHSIFISNKIYTVRLGYFRLWGG